MKFMIKLWNNKDQTIYKLKLQGGKQTSPYQNLNGAPPGGNYQNVSW